MRGCFMCTAKWRTLSFLCLKLAIPLLAFGSAIILFASGLPTLAASYAEGIYEFRLGHYNEASQIFEACTADQPNNSELYYYRALTHEKLRDFQKAVDGYNYVKQHFPKSQAARFAEAALERSSFRKILYAMGLTTEPRNPRLDTFPKETWVNFTRHNNALIMDGAINEHPTKMVFDTGASSCVFSVDQLEE